MLRLPPFTYLAPRTVSEAVEMLGRHGQEVMPVAALGEHLLPRGEWCGRLAAAFQDIVAAETG